MLKWATAVCLVKTTASIEVEGKSNDRTPASWNMLNTEGTRKRIPGGGSVPPETSEEEKDPRSLQQRDTDPTFSVISANIHSMRPRAEVIATWDADIIPLQETKLAPHAIAQTAIRLKQKKVGPPAWQTLQATRGQK